MPRLDLTRFAADPADIKIAERREIAHFVGRGGKKFAAARGLAGDPTQLPPDRPICILGGCISRLGHGAHPAISGTARAVTKTPRKGLIL